MHTNNIVEQIDHVLLMPEPQNAKALFDFFTIELGLPTAWPYKSFGEFSSGAVYFGNVSVEIIEMKGQTNDGPKIAGIAFEPSAKTDAIISGLKNRNISYEEPVPFEINTGSIKKNLWTSTYIKDFVPGSQIFFCEYHMMVPSEERKKLKEKFADCSGGLLKIKKIKEIVITHKNLEASIPQWDRLTAPRAADAEKRIIFKEGPALKFIAGKEDAIESLIVETDSPDKLSQILKENSLVGNKIDRGVELNKGKTFGVSVIVE
jgi:hypothetical protein